MGAPEPTEGRTHGQMAIAHIIASNSANCQLTIEAHQLAAIQHASEVQTEELNRMVEQITEHLQTEAIGIDVIRVYHSCCS